MRSSFGIRGFLLPAGLFALAALSPAFAIGQTASPGDGRGPGSRRGPVEVRDGQVLAHGRLTLPASSPHTTRKGAWSVGVSLLWSNSFSWTQDVPGEDPDERQFLIDGETMTLAADIRRGVGRHVDVGLRVPLQRRWGGILDGFIDAWHRLLNLEDAARPLFLKNAFRVEGQTTARQAFAWVNPEGTGLGDIEVNGRWRAVDGGDDGVSLALVGRVSLPTSTGPFDEGGLGAGGQIATAVPLGRRVDFYAGAGLTVQDPGPVRSLDYARTRGHGFMALEWRPWRRVSLVAETNAATRLVENIRSYPGVHWLLNAEARIDLGSTTRLDLGLTENLLAQQSTTDLGLYFALGWRP